MSDLKLNNTPPFVIAGPCVIESAEMCIDIGRRLKSVCDKLGLTYIFEASFDKANRSSNASFRGPGIVDGLKILQRVKDEVGVPVLTNVHETSHVEPAAKVVDVLQVPAFLARQTDLLVACGKTGRWVNVKKGEADGELVEVSGNLQAGDQVVKRGTDELREGAALPSKAK